MLSRTFLGVRHQCNYRLRGTAVHLHEAAWLSCLKQVVTVHIIAVEYVSWGHPEGRTVSELAWERRTRWIFMTPGGRKFNDKKTFE